MIALVTTYFLAFYILIPGALFRFFTSLFVPLKLFERTRTQEATFAVAVAMLPFALTLAGVWYLPFVRHYPFPIAENTVAQRRLDYHRVATLLTASDASRLLNPAASETTAQRGDAVNQNWLALNRVLRRQSRFLCWFFLSIFGEGVLFGFLASKYGDWQRTPQNEGRLLNRLYDSFTRKFILPNISEWHLLLTDFNWPKKDDIYVSIDVLQNDGHLYKGRVENYFVDSAGKLTGILLETPSRFDRQGYLDARSEKRSAQAPSVKAGDFWKDIPSRYFYIAQSAISNLNVRFVPRDQTLISMAEKILEQGNSHTYTVAVTSDENFIEE